MTSPPMAKPAVRHDPALAFVVLGAVVVHRGASHERLREGGASAGRRLEMCGDGAQPRRVHSPAPILVRHARDREAAAPALRARSATRRGFMPKVLAAFRFNGLQNRPGTLEVPGAKTC